MTTTQWVNTQPDAGALPALLMRIRAHVPATAIDELWIFPSRRIASGESTVFVVAGFDPVDAERRRVITARFTVSRDRKGIASVQDRIDEHGTAPYSAIARMVQGVLRRLGEEGDQPPRQHQLEGEEARWWSLIEELGGTRPPADATESATPAASKETETEAVSGVPNSAVADSET
jgi:phenylpropionate dioxygenase-like ring-hydroxylating dioxygenase large terminal subunit